MSSLIEELHRRVRAGGGGPGCAVRSTSFIAWTESRPHLAALKFAAQEAVSATVWLTLLITIVHTLDGWISLASLALQGDASPGARDAHRLPRPGSTTARSPSCGRASVPEAGSDRRFVGTGLDAWRRGGRDPHPTHAPHYLLRGPQWGSRPLELA